MRHRSPHRVGSVTGLALRGEQYVRGGNLRQRIDHPRSECDELKIPSRSCCGEENVVVGSLVSRGVVEGSCLYKLIGKLNVNAVTEHSVYRTEIDHLSRSNSE